MAKLAKFDIFILNKAKLHFFITCRFNIWRGPLRHQGSVPLCHGAAQPAKPYHGTAKGICRHHDETSKSLDWVSRKRLVYMNSSRLARCSLMNIFLYAVFGTSSHLQFLEDKLRQLLSNFLQNTNCFFFILS